MQKVSVELSAKQAEALADQLVEQLDASAKLRLTEKLERAIRRGRWEPLLLKMRRRLAHRRVSASEIRRLCEAVRQDRFESRQSARGH